MYEGERWTARAGRGDHLGGTEFVRKLKPFDGQGRQNAVFEILRAEGALKITIRRDIFRRGYGVRCGARLF